MVNYSWRLSSLQRYAYAFCDYEFVNEIIMSYLVSFVELGDFRITERWNGLFKNQRNIDLILHPEGNVTIVNGWVALE